MGFFFFYHGWDFFFYHGFNGFNGLDGWCPVGGWKKNINQINPLERMEGDALADMLPPWSYKSELLTPKPKAYHHLPYIRSPSSPRR